MCQVVVPNDHHKGHTRQQNAQYYDPNVLPNDLIQLDLFDGYFQSPPAVNGNGNDFVNYGGQLPQYEGNLMYNNNLNVVMGVPNSAPHMFPVEQTHELGAPQPAKQAGAAKPGRPPAGKRKSKKTPEEAAAQIERVKQRRRESAQRSRNRKCEYVKTLEEENRILKNENEYLRQLLSQKQSFDSAKEVATGIVGESVISRVEGEPVVKHERASSSGSLTPSLEELIEMNEPLPALSDILGIAM